MARTSVFDSVWCLHHLGWSVSEIDEALHIGHARDAIVSSWLLDSKQPSSEEMAMVLREVMDGKPSKPSGSD